MSDKDAFAKVLEHLEDVVKPANLNIGSGTHCVHFAQTELGEFYRASGITDEFGLADAISIISNVVDRFVEAAGNWNRTHPERHRNTRPDIKPSEIRQVMDAIDPADGYLGDVNYPYGALEQEAKRELAQAWMMLTFALKQYNVNPFEELRHWAIAKSKKE